MYAASYAGVQQINKREGLRNEKSQTTTFDQAVQISSASYSLQVLAAWLLPPLRRRAPLGLVLELVHALPQALDGRVDRRVGVAQHAAQPRAFFGLV